MATNAAKQHQPVDSLDQSWTFNNAISKANKEEDSAQQLAEGDDKRDQPIYASDELKLDVRGLPLVPQPSRFKDDPLVSMHVYCAETIVNPTVELAFMAQVGCIDSGWIYGILGAIQCCPGQPLPGAAQRRNWR